MSDPLMRSVSESRESLQPELGLTRTESFLDLIMQKKNISRLPGGKTKKGFQAAQVKAKRSNTASLFSTVWSSCLNNVLSQS